MQKHVRKTYTLSPKALEALDNLADYHDMKKSAVINYLLTHSVVSKKTNFEGLPVIAFPNKEKK